MNNTTTRPNHMEHSGNMALKLSEVSQLIKESSLDIDLINLVNIRASQINGCTFCNDMHVKEAKISGERELRIYHISTWKESSLFTAKEKAALAWTETVTHISSNPPSEELFEELSKHFTEKEISDLTFAVATINAWNRIGVSLSSPHGELDSILGLDKAGLN